MQSHYYKEGQAITFNLMVRSKGNIIVKDKAVSEGATEETKEPTKLYTNHFPRQNELEYKQTRMLLSDSTVLRGDL